MAPKQVEVMEKPPLVSSSEEEDEESGSSGEESESSETDLEHAKKKQSQNTVVNKPMGDNSGSAVTLPESSKTKRPLKQGDDEANKKMKTSMTEHVKKPAADEKVKKISGEEAKKMFQRLFSETDEIALLQGILDFTGDISEDVDAFCDYAKKLINFDANKSQIVTKIQRLKKKFANIVKKSLKKGKGEEEIKFSKDLDQKAFDLSKNIWGSKGVLTSKSRKKLGGTSKEIKSAPKEIKLAHSPKKLEETQNPNANVVKNNVHLSSSSREMARFFKAENMSVLGLDESTITAGWDMVEDGPKKIELEEELKKLKAKQVELCVQRIALVDNATKMLFKDNGSSS